MAYPRVLATIGDHIRRRRLDLGLRQKDVAKLLGVDTTTVTNWEKNHTEPALRIMPPMLRFLGYIPKGAEGPLCSLIRTHRRLQGISQKHLAMLLGVDPTTLARWESGKSKPSGKHRDHINQILGCEPWTG